MPVAFTRITDLLWVHQWLDHAVERVCWALLLGDVESAEAWRQHLDAVLRWHLHGENRVLLPEYVARVTSPPPFGAADIIYDEHCRFEVALDGLWSGVTEPVGALRRVRALAGALEHHDAREAQSLKPLLEPCLSPRETREVLDAMTVGWPASLDALPTEPVATEVVPIAAHPALATDFAGWIVQLQSAVVARDDAQALRTLAAFDATLAAAEASLPPADARLREGQRRKVCALVEDVADLLTRSADLTARVRAFDRLETLRRLWSNVLRGP